MLGVERDSNGWKAHALELWVESRERSLMTCASGTTASPELGFVEQAERDRYVAGRLRHRAAIDRVEAAELWRCHSLRFVHRREVPSGFHAHQCRPDRSGPHLPQSFEALERRL